MREIPLTQGYVAIVDEADYEWLSQWKWQYYQGYARRTSDHKGSKTYMHNAILGVPEGLQADHINFNTLDNRRTNLRIVTPAENSQHRRPSILNTSGFKGVTWHKGVGKWQAFVRTLGENYYLGLFHNREDAARAYDEAARRLFGEYAYLNYPEKGEAK